MSEIVFKINGKQHVIRDRFGPDVSLNEYVRVVAGFRGTKAMCLEGGCGACLVAARAPHPLTGEMQVFTVNSCLVSVLSCHGWELTTIEGIGNRTAGYHDVQSRLAAFNGTQCGYCTPGWVVNMYSLCEAKNYKLSMEEIENSFAGNICRCTGYRPIADAFKSFAKNACEQLRQKVCDLEDLAVFKPCGVQCGNKCHHKKTELTERPLLGKFDYESDDSKLETKDDDWCILNSPDNKMLVLNIGNHVWYKAYSLDEVFQAMGDKTDYKLLAGNTGQGVYHVTDYPKNVIDISNVSAIKGHSIDVNLVLGAGMPLAEMMDVFKDLSLERDEFSYLKEFYDHMDLVAHVPVRNIGTIGGNLFMKYEHNDFQSDVFLLFETVGASISIGEANKEAVVMYLKDFLKTDMKGKIILNIKLPPLSHNYLIKTYKIMPRSQNAHALVNAGFMFRLDKGTKKIAEASIVFGSISPTFIHATKTEAILVGKDLFTNDTLQLALKTLADEIKPEKAPAEPSVAYRKMLAISLFYKAILSLSPENAINKRMRSGGSVIKRSVSQGTQTYDTDKSVWPLNQPIPKIEALVQCSGEAVFANDLPAQPGEVYGALVLAKVPAGSVIDGFDSTEARKLDGVVAFYTAKDIPGKNTFVPKGGLLIEEDEEILCSKIVKYFGQPVAIIVANREKVATKAADLVKVKYATINKNKPMLTIADVLKSPEKKTRVVNNKTVEPTERGDDIKCVINGEYTLESQYHYFMEPQTCVAKPTEDGMEVYSATQWMDLTNTAISECLKVPANRINVIVRRVGGAYGGKITRATMVACAAALVSHLLGTTCRFILPLETNMRALGKRIATRSEFEVGVNKDGMIQYLKNVFYQDNGCSSNESTAPITLEHFYNCYDRKRWHIEANSVLTDTPSNTWCRSPASCEGVAMAEYIMERIAYNLGKDPIEVRLLNMAKEDNPIPELIQKLKTDSNYDTRMEDILKFNEQNRWRKRAMKLLPMTYGLFYLGNYSAIINIYHSDGTVVITHSGVEMGQGINTKTAQVCAHMLGVPLDKISVKPSNSFATPNAMVTGGSIGSESVAFATVKACEKMLKKLEPIRKKLKSPSWEELIKAAYDDGVDLQDTYMVVPMKEIEPYDVYGVVILELELDVLTGNHEVLRVDLLEDTGRSLSPEIDIGQIEGAFIMGLGYWTYERLIYDETTGELLTDRTWTYKPPGLKDIPRDMRIYFRRNTKNKFGVLQSKATGEPALCLAVVVTHALREAARAARLDAARPDQWVHIQNPCTAEHIFMAMDHKIEDFKLK